MAKAKKPAATLAAPAELERICKGLATLDTILSDDWEMRYYSFDRKWGKARMASMRNGSGDDWFIVFASTGVFVKAFWHEYPHEDADVIYDGLPPKLAPHRRDGAFMIDDGITFGGWHDGSTWTLRGNAKPMKEELAMLTGAPKLYRTYASIVHSAKVPLDAIAHVLAGKKLDAAVVAKINPEATLADVKSELAEIGY
jgi:hypothetical protein